MFYVEVYLDFWGPTLLSRVRLLVTPWAVAHQAPVSMGFSRQEYWSELPESKIDLRTWQFNLDEVNISNHMKENGIFNKLSIKNNAGFLFLISTP